MRIIPLALLAALTVACSGPQTTSVPTAASTASPQGSVSGAGQAIAPTAEQVAAAKQTLASALPATVSAKTIERIAAGLRHFGADLQIARVEVGPDGVVNAPAGADVLVIKTSDTVQTKVVPPAGARAVVFEGAGGVNVTFDDRPAKGYRLADADTPADVTLTVNPAAAEASDPTIANLIGALKKSPNVVVATDNGATTATISGAPVLRVDARGQLDTLVVPPPSDRVVALSSGQNNVNIQDGTNSAIFTGAGTNTIQAGTGITSVEFNPKGSNTITRPDSPVPLDVSFTTSVTPPTPTLSGNSFVIDTGSASTRIQCDATIHTINSSNRPDFTVVTSRRTYNEIYFLTFLLERITDYEEWLLGGRWFLWYEAWSGGAELKTVAEAMMRESRMAYLAQMSDQEVIDMIVQKTDLVRAQDLKVKLQDKLKQGMSRADLFVYVANAWANNLDEFRVDDDRYSVSILRRNSF